MNSKKTEFILFGSSVQLAKCTMKSLNVNGEIIPKVNVVRQLGVFLDQNLNFKHHIMTKCTSAMASLAKIKGIRNYLTKEAVGNPGPQYGNITSGLLQWNTNTSARCRY